MAVVPAEFPITLSLAVTMSLLYLFTQHIFCTEPFRVPYAGQVDICAFDKTGTLTSDSTRVLGVYGVSSFGSSHSGEKGTNGKKEAETSKVAATESSRGPDLNGKRKMNFEGGQRGGEDHRVLPARKGKQGPRDDDTIGYQVRYLRLQSGEGFFYHLQEVQFHLLGVL